MSERNELTLADAQRQVYWRRIIGGLLVGLAIGFLLLFIVKQVYIHLSYSLFAAVWGAKLRHFIDLLLKDWAVLELLWRAIPPWQPVVPSPIPSIWKLIYVSWFVMVVITIGRFLLRSASARSAQVMEFHREMQRETWRQQARADQGLTPDNRATTTVIGQAILYQYPAPSESWNQTTLGIVILGLIVALIGGVILLCVEYRYFVH